MKSFNYQSELKKIIDNKELVEITLTNSKSSHFKGYLLHADSEYLIFAAIGNEYVFQGVGIVRKSYLESIQVETHFVSQWKKGIKDDSIYAKAQKSISSIKEFSFEGFVKAFEGTETLVDVVTEVENYTGKIIGHDDEILVIDEYFAEYETRYSRAFINPANIQSITIDSPWLDLLKQAMADRKSEE